MEEYLAAAPRLFERAREDLGEEVALLHDVNSRLTPKQAVLLAHSLEPSRLFFLEDVFPPSTGIGCPRYAAPPPYRSRSAN
jgi:mannonate dehydratase